VTNYCLRLKKYHETAPVGFDQVPKARQISGRLQICTAITPTRIDLCLNNAKTVKVPFANARARVLQSIPSTVPSAAKHMLLPTHELILQ
jgi:hypothetical protein